MDLDGIHYYEPSQGHRLKQNPFTAIVAPRPIGWISTMSETGQLNLRPIACSITSSSILLLLRLGRLDGRTVSGTLRKPVNSCGTFVTKEIGDQMNRTAQPVPHEFTGFRSVPDTVLPSNRPKTQ